MVLHDKSELKRRVRALVKRAKAIDVYAPVSWADGPWGVDAMLQPWLESDRESIDECFQRRCVQGLPLEKGAVETFAALEAMDMPMMDLQVIREREKALGREGYALLAMESAGLEKVFTPVGLENAQETLGAMKAFAPQAEAVLRLSAKDAPPQRYGTHYAACAKQAQEILAANGLRSVMFSGDAEDAAMLQNCAAPLCEDENAVLHIRADVQLAPVVKRLTADFPRLRMIVDLSDDEASLFAAGGCERVVPCVSLAGFAKAMAARGTAFIPFASGASQPGQLIGRWQQARGDIAQQLTQALLPLARTGFLIHSEDIEAHIAALMGGNVRALYE